MAANDAAGLRALLVDDSGRPVNASEFVVASRAETNLTIKQLVSAAQHRSAEIISARYRLNDGQVVVLESVNREFRVRFAPFPVDCPASVGDALTGLRYAVERGTWASTASVASGRLRADADMEQRALLNGLQFVEELDVDATRGRAEVTLPTGHIIVLLEQRNCWRVDEVR